MHGIGKVPVRLGYGYKSAGKPQFQGGLMELAQRNAQIHLLDQLFRLSKSGFIRRLEMIQVPGFAYPPGLRVGGGRCQPDHFQRLGVSCPGKGFCKSTDTPFSWARGTPF